MTMNFLVGGGAAGAAYGNFQARGQIGIAAAGLWHSHNNNERIQATGSVTYTAARGNAGSLTHWVRPRIEPASSWILVGFGSTELQD